jgi:hypothetical protein
MPLLRPSFLSRHVLARYQPSAFLLGAQLLMLLLYPALDETLQGRTLLAAFGTLVLVLAVWVVSRSPAATWIAWALAIPAIALVVLATFRPDPGVLAWAGLFESAVYLYAAGSLIVYMMEDYRVTADELFAAGATFTLIAWGFAYLYTVCQLWYPGSFTAAVDPEAPRSFLELLFLSFTTLSATGLGDILPLRPQARVLVMLEEFAGIAYLTVVVSRLIGLMLFKAGERRRR